MVNFDLKGDIPLPDNVKRYYFPGTGHGGGQGGFALHGTNVFQRRQSRVLKSSAVPSGSIQIPRRTTDAALDHGSGRLGVDRDTAAGKPIPSFTQGELVKDSIESYPFPHIPNVPKPFGRRTLSSFTITGPSSITTTCQGSSSSFPDIEGVVPALVAKVDADGNETSGVPSVSTWLPLALTSWNTAARVRTLDGVRARIPVALFPSRTREQNVYVLADPRPSIEERYGTRQGYLCAVRSRATVDKRALSAQRGCAASCCRSNRCHFDWGSIFLPTAATARSRILCGHGL